MPVLQSIPVWRQRSCSLLAPGVAAVTTRVVSRSSWIEAAPPNEIEGIGVVALRDRLWAATAGDGLIREVDPHTRKPARKPIPIAQGVVRLTAGTEALWAVDQLGGRLARVDPKSGHASFASLESTRLPDLAINLDSVFVSTNDANRPGVTITRIDARSGRPEGDRFHFGFYCEAIAASAEAIWLADQTGRAIRRVDPDNGHIAGRPIKLGHVPIKLLFSAGKLFALAVDPAKADRFGAVIQIDPRSERIVGKPIRVHGGPSAMTADRRRLWIATRGGGAGAGTIVTVDLRSWRIARSPIAVGPYPLSLTRLDGALWVADGVEHSLRRVDLRD
jgi:streptogramin lyase